MISGIVTAFLLAAFLGITAWAWSSRQRERFHEAARLPLDDEHPRTPAALDAGLPPCCRGAGEPRP